MKRSRLNAAPAGAAFSREYAQPMVLPGLALVSDTLAQAKHEQQEVLVGCHGHLCFLNPRQGAIALTMD